MRRPVRTAARTALWELDVRDATFANVVSEARRSLGTFMILDNIARVRRLGLPYLYLGYWVRGSRKMDYKSRFLPQERLTAEGWTLHRSNVV